MHRLVWLVLMGCPWSPPATDAPAPVQTAPATPTIEGLASWLVEDHGLTPERFDDVLRVVTPVGSGPLGVTIQVWEDPPAVHLQTTGLLTLREASGERGVVVLLSTIAALNYELDLGKLALNPASGEVVLSLELEADDGVSRQAFGRALERLVRTADTVRPRLQEAARGPAL